MGLNKKWKLSPTQSTIVALLSKGHGSVCYCGTKSGWRATNRAGQEWGVSRSTLRALTEHGLIEEVNNSGLRAHYRMKVKVMELHPCEFVEVS
jgi:hypothetical protein